MQQVTTPNASLTAVDRVAAGYPPERRRKGLIANTVGATVLVAAIIGPLVLQKYLVIDPTLFFSTYLGGSAGDGGGSIAIDSDGNVGVGCSLILPDGSTMTESVAILIRLILTKDPA